MKFAFVVAVGLAALSSSALAQPYPVCTGHPAVVRISKLSPTGTMAGLAKAVADHQAWYNSHGSPSTRVVMASVTPSVAGAVEVVTLNIDPTPPTQRTQIDDAWKAFTKEYGDNSIIEWTGLTCLTDAEAKGQSAGR